MHGEVRRVKARAFVKHPLVLALGAGIVSATGFEPLGVWPLALAALAVLIHLVAHADNGKRAALLG